MKNIKRNDQIFLWMSEIKGLLIAVIVLFTIGLPGIAHSLHLLQLETVNYEALDGQHDRASIAVREDGLVRIAITDYDNGCCPIVAPLKVATRGPMGGWTHHSVTNFGDHHVPHFMPSGELGVLYMDYEDGMTIKFATVSDTSSEIESVITLGCNPSGFTHLTPWEIEGTNNIQAVVRSVCSKPGYRLRRTATDWNFETFSEENQDLAVGSGGEILILSSEGLHTFLSPELNEPGVLTSVNGGVPLGGNLIVDGIGRIHIAYSLNDKAIYGLLETDTWKLETVAEDIGGLLNDQSLLVDSNQQPHLIFQNSQGRIAVASRLSNGWVEEVDLGPGSEGNMVFGPSGDIHATFTSDFDKIVRYARLAVGGFVDVPLGYWAEGAIYKIYNAGITKGCSQTPLMYCPENTVNRDQMAVFLGRATHDSNFTPPDATGLFADVPKWYWAADWIEQFWADGLTKGCKIDPHDLQSPVIYYCPERPVTRTTMAIFLLRAKHGSNYTPPPAIGIFEDVWVKYWAADWIEQLYKEGITVGCQKNPLMYCPEVHVTRAQMAVFMMRTFGL